MGSVSGGRHLALPAIEERRLRQELLAHYRGEKDGRGRTGQYPNTVLQDLRPAWRAVAVRVVPAGPLGPGLVDYGDLVALANEQAWEEEAGGEERDGQLVAYLARLRRVVADMRLCLNGEPTGWALAEVHADVRGYPLYYGTMQSYEEATIRITAAPSHARVIAYDRDGKPAEQRDVEPREPFRFAEWDELGDAVRAVSKDRIAAMRAAFADRDRFPRANRANKTRSPETVAALYSRLRSHDRLDKATADLARDLAKEIGLDFAPAWRSART